MCVFMRELAGRGPVKAQVQGGQKIVGDAVRELGQQVCRRGCHHSSEFASATLMCSTSARQRLIAGRGENMPVMTFLPVSAANVSGFDEFLRGRGHDDLALAPRWESARASSAAL
jgi:hypothetical protein